MKSLYHFVVLVVPSVTSGAPPENKRKLEIVIAKSVEYIAWSYQYRNFRTVYCKADDPEMCGPTSIPLPNVGREGHTYLHHIVEHYDNLADWTVFTTGTPREGFNHDDMVDQFEGGKFFNDLVAPPEQLNGDDSSARFLFSSKFHLSRGHRAYRTDFWREDPGVPRNTMCPTMEPADTWTQYLPTETHDFLSKSCHTSVRNIGRLVRTLWHDYVGLPLPPNHIFYFTEGSRFAASRARIRERSKEEYARLLEAMSHHNDPCLSSLVEYWWWYLIGRPTGSPCPAQEIDKKLWAVEPVIGNMPCKGRGDPNRHEVEVVIAYYNEDISWLDDCRHLTTVYCKAKSRGDCPAGSLHIENVGREGHTFLNHIVSRYDDLADWTVFYQAEEPTEGYDGVIGGHIMHGATFADYLNYPRMRGYDDDPDSFFIFSAKMHLPSLNKTYRSTYRGAWDVPTPDLGRIPPKCPYRAKDDVWDPWIVTGEVDTMNEKWGIPHEQAYSLGEEFWYKYVQLPMPPWKIMYYAQGAIFAVSRARIRERPKEEYEKLLRPMSSDKDPIHGWFTEWWWWYIIGRPTGNPCPTERSDTNIDTFPPPPFTWNEGNI